GQVWAPPCGFGEGLEPPRSVVRRVALAHEVGCDHSEMFAGLAGRQLDFDLQAAVLRFLARVASIGRMPLDERDVLLALGSAARVLHDHSSDPCAFHSVSSSSVGGKTCRGITKICPRKNLAAPRSLAGTLPGFSGCPRAESARRTRP